MRREPVEDLRRFLDAPRRHVLVQSTFVALLTARGTLVSVAWGRVERESIGELTSFLEAAITLGTERRQLFDLRRIESYSVDAMEELLDFYRTSSTYTGAIAREAVLRSSGLVGVFAEGFFRASPPPFAARVFTNEAEALAWLDDPDGLHAAPIEAWIAAGPEERSVWAVEREVARLGAGAKVADVASAMATSERSLQRVLARRGTSFRELRREVLAAEVDRLRATTPWTLEHIAMHLGFRRAARLTELYREARGYPPSADTDRASDPG